VSRFYSCTSSTSVQLVRIVHFYAHIPVTGACKCLVLDVCAGSCAGGGLFLRRVQLWGSDQLQRHTGDGFTCMCCTSTWNWCMKSQYSCFGECYFGAVTSVSASPEMGSLAYVAWRLRP